MPLRLVHPVHRATHRIGLYLDDLGESGLTQGEAHILALLAHSGPANVAHLHRGLAHKRSTLTSILDRLAKRGLITRAVGETDRRTFVVRPTAKGRKLAHRVQRHLSALERAVIHRVTDADIKGFDRVIAALEQEAHQRCNSKSIRRSRERKKTAAQTPATSGQARLRGSQFRSREGR